MIEKYDYMQSSKYLVEIIFENIDLSPSVVDEKKKLAEGLKIKINEQFIPDIINLVKSVGEKQIDLIDRFINVVNDSVYNFKNNIELLKKECTEGLDIIKQDAHIENLMINEDVFLLIDRKYKEIEDERSRIISDQSKYNELNDRFNSIKLLIEDFYCINNDSITKFKSDSIYSHLK
jgi:hypothetical protein